MHYILITTDKGKVVAINLDHIQQIEPTGLTGPAIFTRSDGTTITTKNPIEDVWGAIQAIQNPFSVPAKEAGQVAPVTIEEVREESAKKTPWNKGKTYSLSTEKSKTPEVAKVEEAPKPAPKVQGGTRSAGMFTPG